MGNGDTVPVILYLGPAQRTAISYCKPRSIYCQRKETLVEQDYAHKVPSFCMTTFSASLTNLTVLLPQSRYYASRRILAPPPLWLHKYTGLRAHEFAHLLRLANVTCAWSWKLYGINLLIPTEQEAGCATEMVRTHGKENCLLIWRDIRVPPRCSCGLRSGFVRSVDR
jgi:hypothetical protein